MSSHRVMLRRLASATAALSAILLATCDLDKITKPLVTDGGTPVNFTIAGGNSVSLGGTLQLTVSLPESAPAAITRWTSLTPGKASVNSETGIVTGLQTGPAIIQARLLSPELDTGVVQNHSITVRYNGIRVAAVDSIEGLGLLKSISAVGLDAANDEVTSALAGVAWTSRDTSIFTIVGEAVRAKAAGQARLVGEYDGLRDSVLIRVRPVAKTIVFDSVFVADAVNANRTIPLLVKDLNDSTILAPTATWRIADTSVAEIGAASGVLRFKKLDTTRVFAKVDSVERSIKVKVVQVPASLVREAGDMQTDTVVQTLSDLLTVTVLDAGTTPIAGAQVVFSVGSGEGAAITDSVKTTDLNGQATLGGWTLGTNAGEQTVVASSNGASTTFTATAVADVPTQIGFIDQPVSTHVATTLPALTVAVLDQYGNKNTSAADAITVAFGDNPGGSTLGGTTTVNAVDGVAMFEDLTVDNPATGYTLVATATGFADVTSEPFAAFGDATQLVFTVQPTGSSIGATLSPVTVEVRDAAGNVVSSANSSITLTFASNPGAATLGGTTTVQAVNGVATFGDLSVGAAGIGYTLRASIGSAPAVTAPVSQPFTISNVGPAARVEFSVAPSDVVAGQQISPAIVVRVVDANGALATTYSGQVSLEISSGPDGAGIAGTLTRSFLNGEATFDNLVLNDAGTYRLLANGAFSLQDAISDEFEVTAGGASALVFVQQPTYTPVGQAMSVPVRVAVADASGNTVTGSAQTAVTLTLVGTSCTATLSGLGPVNTVNGVASFPGITSPTQFSNCFLRATATGLSPALSDGFAVVATGAPVQVTFISQPFPTATAGLGVSGGSVAFQNANGQSATAPFTMITVSVLPGSPGGIDGGATSKGTTNSVTFDPLTFNTAGTYRLVASAPGYKPDTSNTFVVNPAAVDNLEFLVFPHTTVAGVPFSEPIQVALKDGLRNTVTAAAPQTIALRAHTGPPNLFPLTFNTGTDTVFATTVDGVATFPADLAVNVADLQAFLVAEVPGTSITGRSSFEFDIVRGPLATMGVTVQPQASVNAGATLNTIEAQAQDSVGNAYPEYGQSVTVSLAGGPAGAVLSGITTQSASNGVVSFSGLSIDKAGTYQLQITGNNLVPTLTDSFTVEPLTPVGLSFVRQPGPTTYLNAPLSPFDTVIVAIVDALGNTVTTSNDNITFAIGNNPSAGSLTGILTISTVDGEARLGSDVMLNTVGSGYTITATSGTLGLGTVSSDAFDVTQFGPAANLVFTTQPTNTLVGNAISPAVVVEIQDAFGNLITSGSESGSQVLLTALVNGSGEWFADASGGVATFPNLIPTQVGTGLVLSANIVGLLEIDAPSTPFDVTAGETLMAETDKDIWDVTLAPSAIVWSERTRIQSVPITGGTATLLATAGEEPVAITNDGTDVYWIETGALKKVPLAGGTVTTLVTGITQPHGQIEVDGSFVYFGEIDQLRSVSKSATNLDVSATTLLYTMDARKFNVRQFVLTGSTLVFSSGNAVLAGPSSGGSATTIVNDGAASLTVNGSTLYYIAQSDGVLRSVPLSGGAATDILALAKFGKLISDGLNVYWADLGVFKISIADGSWLQLSQNEAWGIAIDASNIYWGSYVPETNGTKIFKAPK